MADTEYIQNLISQDTLVKYIPPIWAKQNIPKEHIPKTKLNLSNTNTPINNWPHPDVPNDFNLYIKRCDLNGSILGGNKIKKLEFSLAKAITEGCNHIITTGSTISNHCRTTALACASLNLKCTLLQTCVTENLPKDHVTRGNLLLSMMTDAKSVLIPKNTSLKKVNDLLDEIEIKVKEEGDKPFVIRRGGTQVDAVFSYIEVFNEMMNQKYFKDITDIVVTAGSAGTAISLGLASKMSKYNIKIHAVRVWGKKKDHENVLKKELSDLDLNYEDFKDINLVHDNYVGEGYGASYSEIEDTIIKASTKTGIALCSTYTGKTVYGMLDLMNNNPGVFNGKNVLFIHTGGIPGLWGDLNLKKLLQNKLENDSNMVSFEEYMKV